MQATPSVAGCTSNRCGKKFAAPILISSIKKHHL
jgi:hypothetical protein